MARKVTPQAEFFITLLGQLGLNGDVIQVELAKEVGISICTGTVYTYLRRNGAQSCLYRRGMNPDAYAAIDMARSQIGDKRPKRAKK